MEKKILTNDHAGWEEFIEKLRYVMVAHTEFESEISCNKDFRNAKRILSNMPGIDVEGTLEYLKENFGTCDCKVLKVAS